MSFTSYISSFKLNTLYPANYIETLGTGTNKPILTRAMDHNGQRSDIVIKLKDSERMNNSAFLKELVGSLLALELGLQTPIPFIAEISEEFINSQIVDYEYKRIKNSSGINYATENIIDLKLFGPYDTLPISLQNEALRIFYFDLMIQNPDRSAVRGKPNLFTVGLDLWILDHEIAFSFLFPILGRPKTNPWEFHESDTTMIENHILYKKLKRKKLDYSILDNYLDSLDDEFWLTLQKLIPGEWMSKDFQKISEHIISIRANQKSFIKQIKMFLS